MTTAAETSPAPMGRYEAEQKTHRIRLNFDENYRLIREVRDRRGWEAMGFLSFEEWAERNFGQTPGHIGRLLTAARIEEHINDSTLPNGNVESDKPIPEGTLRPLSKLLNQRTGFGEWGERPDAREKINEAWGKAVEQSAGRPTARDVQDAVDDVLGRELVRADRSYEHWAGLLMGLAKHYTMIQTAGGIGYIARGWSEDRRRGYRDHMIETAELFRQIATEIEEIM